MRRNNTLLKFGFTGYGGRLSHDTGPLGRRAASNSTRCLQKDHSAQADRPRAAPPDALARQVPQCSTGVYEKEAAKRSLRGEIAQPSCNELLLDAGC